MKRLLLLSLLVLSGCSKDSEDEDRGTFFDKVAGKYYTNQSVDELMNIYKFNREFLLEEMRISENTWSCDIKRSYRVLSITKEDSNSVEGQVEYIYGDLSSFESPFRFEISEDGIIYVGLLIPPGNESSWGNGYTEVDNFLSLYKPRWITKNEQYGSNDGSCQVSF